MKKTWRFWIMSIDTNESGYYEFKNFKIFQSYKELTYKRLDNTNLNSFEKYLIKIGYIRNRFNFKTMSLTKTSNNDILSTMGNIDFRYTKEGEKTITYGLCEGGKPPTLIYPRPKGIISDDMMNRILQTYSSEELYKIIK